MYFFFASRRRHTRFKCDWSSDVCSSDLLRPEPVVAEPPPETTRIRLVRSPAICISPLYLAEELLRLEGFTEIEYVRMTGNLLTQAVAAGRGDGAMHFISPPALSLDRRAPVATPSRGPAGCFRP